MSWGREKYFRCGVCGDLITRSEILKARPDSKLSICYCEIDNIPLYEIPKREYKARLKEVIKK